jgi:GT2 family glycosyltransferase
MNSEGQSKIYVLLPVHNRRATTEKFIRCLCAQTYGNWHLVLIDDGSSDGTEAMARGLVPSLTVLHGQGNWWWAGSLQRGYEWLRQNRVAPKSLVLIANDDTEFEPDFLVNAVGAVKPRSLVLARQFDRDTGDFVESGVHWNWRKLALTVVRGDGEINCFSTRGLFLRAADFMEIGGFHPVLLPHYLSDYEFTIRAHRRGFALLSAPEVFLRNDATLTGIHKVEGHSLIRTLLITLSRKSASNPLSWTSFILLACPPRYIPINILRVWRQFLAPVTQRIRSA